MRSKKKILIWTLALLGCGGELPGQTLRLFCASSLSEIMPQLMDGFAQQNSVTFETVYGSSSLLTNQLLAGASADLFIVVGTPQDLKLTGSSAPTQVKILGSTQLALVFRRGLTALPLPRLAEPQFRLGLADEGVPLGYFTQKLLQNAVEANLITPLQKKQIEKNNILREFNAQSLKNKLLLGEVDAVVLYRSQLVPLPATQLPDAINPPVSYVAGVTSTCTQPQLAEAWMRYLVSAPARAIFAKRGIQ